MEIREFARRKELLENEISDFVVKKIYEFEDETGVDISHMDIDAHQNLQSDDVIVRVSAEFAFNV